jgi:hypothetical protein
MDRGHLERSKRESRARIWRGRRRNDEKARLKRRFQSSFCLVWCGAHAIGRRFCYFRVIHADSSALPARYVRRQRPAIPLLQTNAPSLCAGTACSFASLVLVLAASSGQKWARDAVNSVDIGLWFLTVRCASNLAGFSPLTTWMDRVQGTGVRYKLINAGAAVDSSDVTAADQPFTLYSSFW